MDMLSDKKYVTAFQVISLGAISELFVLPGGREGETLGLGHHANTEEEAGHQAESRELSICVVSRLLNSQAGAERCL